MAKTLEIARELFLDTSFAIALSSSSDDLHSAALRWAEILEANQPRLVTTRAVMLEIGNALSKRKFHGAAVQLLESLETDSNIEIVSLTDELYVSSFQLFRQRNDKDWGLTDCVSFVVMQRRNLNQALTADDHFRQMGFRALLREPLD